MSKMVGFQIRVENLTIEQVVSLSYLHGIMTLRDGVFKSVGPATKSEHLCRLEAAGIQPAIVEFVEYT